MTPDEQSATGTQHSPGEVAAVPQVVMQSDVDAGRNRSAM